MTTNVTIHVPAHIAAVEIGFEYLGPDGTSWHPADKKLLIKSGEQAMFAIWDTKRVSYMHELERLPVPEKVRHAGRLYQSGAAPLAPEPMGTGTHEPRLVTLNEQAHGDE